MRDQVVSSIFAWLRVSGCIVSTYCKRRRQFFNMPCASRPGLAPFLGVADLAAVTNRTGMGGGREDDEKEGEEEKYGEDVVHAHLHVCRHFVDYYSAHASFQMFVLTAQSLWLPVHPDSCCCCGSFSFIFSTTGASPLSFQLPRRFAASRPSLHLLRRVKSLGPPRFARPRVSRRFNRRASFPTVAPSSLLISRIFNGIDFFVAPKTLPGKKANRLCPRGPGYPAKRTTPFPTFSPTFSPTFFTTCAFQL